MLRFPFVLLRNLFAFLAFLWSSFWHKVRYFFRRKKKLYISVELEEDYAFGPPPGLAAYFREEPSFLELRERLERIRESDEIDGLTVETNGLAMGSGRTEAMAELLDGVRESGKRVVVHTRMPTTNEYLLATAADEILLTPSGHLQTFGPRFDQFFGAEALDRLGIQRQMIHIGAFKTATHQLLYTEMTAPQEAMMRSMHNSMLEGITDRISERRHTPKSGADALFRNAPLDPSTARSMGFIDGAVARGRLEAWLAYGRRMYPSVRPLEWEPEPPLDDGPPDDVAEEPAQEEADYEKFDDILVVPEEDSAAVLPPELDWKPLFSPTPRIATLDLTGMILMPGTDWSPGSAPVIDPDEVVPKLREIRESGMFNATILHINSPGGSALASEIIWEEIQRVRVQMPVVAYCSDVAGSGGYYLAVSADHIFSQSLTLTGSIGVVTGKNSVPHVPEKFGINVESIYEHEADTYTSLVHPLSDDLMERMGEQARSFYRQFLRRVGQNRQLPRRRLHRYARGRVYMGKDAVRRGLIDEIGDLGDAFETACDLANLDADRTELSYLAHRQHGFRQMLGLQASLESLVPEGLGPAGSTFDRIAPENLVEPLLATRMLERENLLALMSTRVVWGRSGRPN